MHDDDSDLPHPRPPTWKEDMRKWLASLADSPSGPTKDEVREDVMRDLVDRAAKQAVECDWDLSAFCDLAAKAFERHGGRVG